MSPLPWPRAGVPAAAAATAAAAAASCRASSSRCRHWSLEAPRPALPQPRRGGGGDADYCRRHHRHRRRRRRRHRLPVMGVCAGWLRHPRLFPADAVAPWTSPVGDMFGPVAAATGGPLKPIACCHTAQRAYRSLTPPPAAQRHGGGGRHRGSDDGVVKNGTAAGRLTLLQREVGVGDGEGIAATHDDVAPNCAPKPRPDGTRGTTTERSEAAASRLPASALSRAAAVASRRHRLGASAAAAPSCSGGTSDGAHHFPRLCRALASRRGARRR